ncbi:MAG: hypothetical protein QNK11_01770 [Legionella sp.]|nr:hypothetical protein [Legionella sp.]
MRFVNYLMKVQFKLDCMPLLNRIAIGCGLLLAITLCWLFLVCFPLSHQTAAIQRQIKKTNDQYARFSVRNERISKHIKAGSMDELIEHYQKLQNEKKGLDEAIKKHQFQYIDDKMIAKLLHSMLHDMHNLSIEHFSTLAREEKPAVRAAVTSTKKSDKKADEKADEKLVSSETNRLLEPEVTHYSLSLRGDYFSIMKFLQRVEQLKWQLFWDKFSYRVEKHPVAIATIEFYTLKSPKVVPSIPKSASQGEAE